MPHLFLLKHPDPHQGIKIKNSPCTGKQQLFQESQTASGVKGMERLQKLPYLGHHHIPRARHICHMMDQLRAKQRHVAACHKGPVALGEKEPGMYSCQGSPPWKQVPHHLHSQKGILGRGISDHQDRIANLREGIHCPLNKGFAS